jgi:uncharacterized protein YjbI with pentapeptide repeats
MNPTVVAAWIAAGVSVLTLIGTLAAQYFGRRGTNKDTEKAFAEQREQLDRTLAEQARQLDLTLAEQRTRTLNERFATAAEELGSDKPAVRLAGVYAMAGLADDWRENRQTCVDVLCAYLRMPYAPDPGPDAPEPHLLAFQANREVRHTVIRVITAHLRDNAAVSWHALDLDFTGVVFDGGDFSFARFSGDYVDFTGAEFLDGEVSFDGVVFSGGTVMFCDTLFSGGVVDFTNAEVSGVTVVFTGAQFSAGVVSFMATEFCSNGIAAFNGAAFSGGVVDFDHARFSGGLVRFVGARFCGGTVDFTGAEFCGGVVDFHDPADWSCPPDFPWADTPPAGVRLPSAGGTANRA